MVRVGIDLGGTATKMGLVSEHGQLLALCSFPTQAQDGPEAMLNDIAERCLDFCKQNGYSPECIQCIGFGTPGLVDRENATVMYSSNLGLRDVPIRAHLQKTFPDVPIYLENDANCAALAEAAYGAARAARSSVTLTLGTGVGAGVILDGRIFVGHESLAPEIGHLIIVADGEACGCGRRGCMEQYISATALVRQTDHAIAEHPGSQLARMSQREPVSAKLPFSAAEQGDDVAQALVDRYLYYLALSISNIIYCYGPEIVLLGGGICNEGDRLLIPLRAQLDAQLLPGSRGKTRLALAQHRNEAGIIGAAALSTLN